MDLTIIIVNTNSKEMLKNCLHSIRETADDLQLQIVVIDNASKDGSRSMVHELFPEVTLLNSGGNIGFARANNLAIPYVQSPFVFFLNPDTIMKDHTLTVMVKFLKENPSVGAMGCKAVGLNGEVQELGIQTFPSPFREFCKLLFVSKRSMGKMKRFIAYHNSLQSGFVQKLYGHCLMVRKEVIDRVGSFDDRFVMYCEDVELSHRIILAGWKLYYLAEVEIIHIGAGYTSGLTNYFAILWTCESLSKLMQKYYGNKGVIMYKGGVFVASNIRLLILFILKVIKRFASVELVENYNNSINKYIEMIKWSLNLSKPTLKQ
jgi:N-acetylglucosaminyl-diphospho-decaprenol L-rhamnosyltransferase